MLSTKQAVNVACGLLLFACLLIFRFEFLLGSEAGETIKRHTGATAVVAGVVADDPDERATTIRVVVEVATINGREGSGRVLVVLSKETPLAFGDRVEVRGVVEEPQAFETDAGRTFDYRGYLRVRGVSATMPYALLRAHEQGGPSLRGALFGAKQRFESALERVLPEPQASLLKGILLGERGGFPQELLQMFVAVGLIHIVVLSGSNISIVAEGVFRALSFLPRVATFTVGGAAIVLFVLMTGSGAAAVRALVMAAIALVARYLRRPEVALRALGIAAAAMVLWNPLFVTDSGFVLSILATFGLITISPWVETRLGAVPAWKRFNLRSIVASTIAVEIFLLPALLYYSGVLSLVALPVNVVVLPFVWVIMLAGFVAGALALVHPLAALLPAFAADMLLLALLWVAQTGAALPFAHTTVAPFPLWVMAAVYVPLFFIAWRLYMRSAKAGLREYA